MDLHQIILFPKWKWSCCILHVVVPVVTLSVDNVPFEVVEVLISLPSVVSLSPGVVGSVGQKCQITNLANDIQKQNHHLMISSSMYLYLLLSWLKLVIRLLILYCAIQACTSNSTVTGCTVTDTVLDVLHF